MGTRSKNNPFGFQTKNCCSHESKYDFTVMIIAPSQRDQIVLPSAVRKQMHLELGQGFRVIIDDKDTILLHRVSRPPNHGPIDLLQAWRYPCDLPPRANDRPQLPCGISLSWWQGIWLILETQACSSSIPLVHEPPNRLPRQSEASARPRRELFIQR